MGFDPVSLANTYSCYSMRLTVVQCAFSGVLLNPPGDSICLGVSLGCALASSSAVMLEALALGLRALTLLDDRAIVPEQQIFPTERTTIISLVRSRFGTAGLAAWSFRPTLFLFFHAVARYRVSFSCYPFLCPFNDTLIVDDLSVSERRVLYTFTAEVYVMRDSEHCTVMIQYARDITRRIRGSS